MQIYFGFLILFAFSIRVIGQDTSKYKYDLLHDKRHYTIIKDHPKIVMPKIMDDNFCQKLHAVNIPKTIEFIDSADGRVVYYFLKLEISFNPKGKVLLIRPASYTKAIQEVAMQIMSLLKSTTWEVSSPKKIKKIDFQCSIEHRGLNDIVLRTTDNYQSENICECSH